MHVDEAHNLATDLLGTILSEARKYRLSLTAATQYLNKIPPTVRSAILGNVGPILSFRLGVEDAESLTSAFAPECRPSNLQAVEHHQLHVKLAVRGTTTRPFRARALPPLRPTYQTQHREATIHRSRQCYATLRAVVEEKINRRLADKTPSTRAHPNGKSFVVSQSVRSGRYQFWFSRMKDAIRIRNQAERSPAGERHAGTHLFPSSRGLRGVFLLMYCSFGYKQLYHLTDSARIPTV